MKEIVNRKNADYKESLRIGIPMLTHLRPQAFQPERSPRAIYQYTVGLKPNPLVCTLQWLKHPCLPAAIRLNNQLSASHSPFLISAVYAFKKLHISPKAEVLVMPREILTSKKEVWVHKREKTHLTNITLHKDYLQVFTCIGSSESTQNGIKPILTFGDSL